MKNKFLKEDGSLDVERINKLPIEKFIEVVGDLTYEQYLYCVSKIPLNESCYSTKAIVVDYTLEEELERGTGVDAMEYLNNWKKQMYKS